MSKEVLSGKGRALSVPWAFYIPQMDESNAKIYQEMEGDKATKQLQDRVNRISNTRLNLDEWLHILEMIEAYLAE